MDDRDSLDEQQARLVRANEAEAMAHVAIARAREIRAALNATEAALDGARQQLDAVLQSTSWRLTAPLRSLVQGYAALRRVLRSGNLKAASTASAGAPAGADAPAVDMPSPGSGGPMPQDGGFAVTELDLRAAFLSWYAQTPIFFPLATAPEVSIIIPVYGGLADLQTCLRSIIEAGTSAPTVEVILVDDNPNDPVLPFIDESPGLVPLANASNLGFLHSCNRGAAAARGKMLCFLNSDTIVAGGWLSALTRALSEESRVGLVGPMLLDNDGTIQEAGWRMLADGSGIPIGRGDSPKAHAGRKFVDCVTGACFMVTAKLWHDLEGFDSRYAPAYYEEFDLAFRALERNFLTLCEPEARVVHLGARSYGASQRDLLSQRNRLIFLDRFAETLQSYPITAWDVRGDIRDHSIS